MIRIEATTLREAYEEAASKLECSAKELEVEIIQKPSPGVFGLFKKNAIIVATKKEKSKKEEKEKLEEDEKKSSKKSSKKEEKKKHKKKDEDEEVESHKKEKGKSKEKKKEKEKEKKEEKKVKKKKTSLISDEDEYYEAIENEESFAEETEKEQDEKEMLSEIKRELKHLFKLTCFEIDKIKVSLYDEHTVSIDINGEDSALLIGKEGYRYKALSYMLYNWINAKYDMQIRLEVAEFLQNQEEAIEKYLETIYEIVEEEGRAQTKVLDGVLVQIALRKLREVYPDKYVVIRSNRDGQKYIIINDFYSN